MQKAQPSAKARIERVLKRFTDPTTPELLNFVSGVNDAGALGTIDDGIHDTQQPGTPDVAIKDRHGWNSLVVLKR